MGGAWRAGVRTVWLLLVAATAAAACAGPGAVAPLSTPASKRTPSSQPAAHAAQPTAALTVALDALRSDRGQVLVTVFRQAAGFPADPERAFARARAPIRSGRAELRFAAVPAGAFAVAALHDEDNDLRMATGFLGIPTEGYGFSRDATGSFGPPSFEAARLWLEAGEHERVQIRMRY